VIPVLRASRRRPVVEWRHEPGPGYDLRQYCDGGPTGLVAATSWHPPDEAGPAVREIPGHDIRLIVERTRVTLLERRAPGYSGVRFRVPIRSCVGAEILDEPGLPGAGLIRLNLTVRFGPDVTVTLPMWFPSRERTRLHDLAAHLRNCAQPPAPPRSVPSLPVLDVGMAPDTDDWVVFRPHRTSSEVLRASAEFAWEAP
jgi:hypothetical protein